MLEFLKHVSMSSYSTSLVFRKKKKELNHYCSHKLDVINLKEREIYFWLCFGDHRMSQREHREGKGFMLGLARK